VWIRDDVGLRLGLRLFFLSPEFDRQLNPIQIETLIELN
jgi:hypothetical protein